VLAGTAYATLSEGTRYFFNYWRLQGPLAGSVIALIYFNWVFACGLTWWRRRAGKVAGSRECRVVAPPSCRRCAARGEAAARPVERLPIGRNRNAL